MIAIGARAVEEQAAIPGAWGEDSLKACWVKLRDRCSAPDFGHPLFSEVLGRADG